MMANGMAIISFLRSRTLTVWLVGLFIAYYLSMAVWVGEAFGRYVIHLSSNNLFRAFYVLFLVNVIFRVFDALRASWRSRPRFFLQLPLLLGLVLLLISFFLSVNMRKMLWSPPLGRGDVITVPWDSLSYQIVSVVPALEKKALRMNDAAVFDFEPGITMRGSDGRQYSIGAFPPQRVGTTYFHVLQFGIGPGIELKMKGEIVSKGYVALRLAPFGSVDTFEMPPFPYTFSLSIIPNKVMKKGKETVRDYDLEKPKYRVEIVKGDRIIAQKETDSSVSFDGEMSISFIEPDDWVLLEIVYDPFLSTFVISLAMLALGVLLYPLTFYNRKKR